MKKSETVDRVKNSLWEEDELLRRLPEIDAIYDAEVREGVIRTFMRGCPDYFWTEPSSSSGNYHSTDEIGKHGNWIHTKRVFAEYCNISESWVEGGWISPKQKEQGKAAALTHDMMKYGWPSEQNDHTVRDHDVIAADVVENIGEMSDDVVRLVHRHMGPWGEGPNPETKAERLLHTADKSAARRENDIGIYYPADELLKEWPDLTVEEVASGDMV
jgi:HD domain.